MWISRLKPSTRALMYRLIPRISMFMVFFLAVSMLTLRIDSLVLRLYQELVLAGLNLTSEWWYRQTICKFYSMLLYALQINTTCKKNNCDQIGWHKKWHSATSYNKYIKFLDQLFNASSWRREMIKMLSTFHNWTIKCKR